MSICPYVCLSAVLHKPVLYRNSLMDQACFWHRGDPRVILHCTKRYFGNLQNLGTSLENIVPNSGLRENFATACRPSKVLSSYVDAEYDKLATFVSRLFITLSVHLCVQHHGRDAARRAGLSVAVETCCQGRNTSTVYNSHCYADNAGTISVTSSAAKSKEMFVAGEVLGLTVDKLGEDTSDQTSRLRQCVASIPTTNVVAKSPYLKTAVRCRDIGLVFITGTHCSG